MIYFQLIIKSIIIFIIISITSCSNSSCSLELATATQSTSCPYLRYEDSSKRDMRMACVLTNRWKTRADHLGKWHVTVQKGVKTSEEK